MKSETYLRICYWWGIIADALLSIEMFASAFLGSISPFTGIGMTIQGGSDYQYAISIAATFMVGWTILLFWADRRPLERKEILLILIFIIMGLRISVFLGYSKGFIGIETFIFDTILSFLYLTFILISYYHSIRIK